jgi:hypothetical protein
MPRRASVALCGVVGEAGEVRRSSVRDVWAEEEVLIVVGWVVVDAIVLIAGMWVRWILCEDVDSPVLGIDVLEIVCRGRLVLEAMI